MTASLDFALSEDQLALREVADRILDDHASPEQLSAIERDSDWFARDAYSALATAGLLGAGLAEAVGGGGGSFLDTAVVLEAVGRHVAPVPVLASVVGGAMPIARYGDDSQRATWVEPALAGEVILAAALQEPGNDDAALPRTTADLGIGGWQIDGEKYCVPAAHLAQRVLVPARTGVGVGVFLIDPHADGVTLTRATATSGEPLFHIALAGARGEAVGDPAAGSAIAAEVVAHTIAGLCVMQVGVSERALQMTAEHVRTREQFGQTLASFQAVSQRAADAFIDTEAIRLTAWQAAWRLSEGLPADDEVAIAKFWAADGGQRVAHAAQHLHGGVGADVDFPLRRYFTWAKTNELMLGSATRQLLRVGARLADGG